MPSDQPRLVYLTAGAGGMFCGSCLHDNALARSLTDQGFDVQLVPTYTPIRTDEVDVSVDQIFFGGINVYLQQKIPPLRWFPSYLDRFLDSPRLIQKVAARAVDLPPRELGRLAVSMLHGLEGNQRKEVKRLTSWLLNSARPDLIIFTNALIGGCIPEIKRRLQRPVLVTLQGDDLFLDSLPEPYREQCIQRIRELVPQIDGFIVHTDFFGRYMSDYFEIPPYKVRVVPLGIDVSQFVLRVQDRQPPLTIGYLARLSPEKGLQNLVRAFVAIKQSGRIAGLQLRVAGWLGKAQQPFAQQCFQEIVSAGFDSDFQYLGSLERTQKLQFLSSLDVLSVPTVYQEPKGLYVLEALACGVPVVQPAHGSFPEIISQSQGGLLFRPNDADDFCDKLMQLLLDDSLKLQLGMQGHRFITTHRNAQQMGLATAQLIREYL